MTDELSPLARMRESAAQRELGDLKTDMQRWAELNRIAMQAEARRELEEAIRLLENLLDRTDSLPRTEARAFLARHKATNHE